MAYTDPPMSDSTEWWQTIRPDGTPAVDLKALRKPGKNGRHYVHPHHPDSDNLYPSVSTIKNAYYSFGSGLVAATMRRRIHGRKPRPRQNPRTAPTTQRLEGT